jgi:hypothetical protein
MPGVSPSVLQRLSASGWYALHSNVLHDRGERAVWLVMIEPAAEEMRASVRSFRLSSLLTGRQAARTLRRQR